MNITKIKECVYINKKTYLIYENTNSTKLDIIYDRLEKQIHAYPLIIACEFEKTLIPYDYMIYFNDLEDPYLKKLYYHIISWINTNVINNITSFKSQIYKFLFNILYNETLNKKYDFKKLHSLINNDQLCVYNFLKKHIKNCDYLRELHTYILKQLSCECLKRGKTWGSISFKLGPSKFVPRFITYLATLIDNYYLIIDYVDELLLLVYKIFDDIIKFSQADDISLLEKCRLSKNLSEKTKARIINNDIKATSAYYPFNLCNYILNKIYQQHPNTHIIQQLRNVIISNLSDPENLFESFIYIYKLNPSITELLEIIAKCLSCESNKIINFILDNFKIYVDDKFINKIITYYQHTKTDCVLDSLCIFIKNYYVISPNKYFEILALIHKKNHLSFHNLRIERIQISFEIDEIGYKYFYNLRQMPKLVFKNINPIRIYIENTFSYGNSTIINNIIKNYSGVKSDNSVNIMHFLCNNKSLSFDKLLSFDNDNFFEFIILELTSIFVKSIVPP